MVEAIISRWDLVAPVSSQGEEKMKEKSGLIRGAYSCKIRRNDRRTTRPVGESEVKTNPLESAGARSASLIKWSNIQADADIETRPTALREALHEVLLAVRTIFSFSMENNGRSSANNQRKYKCLNCTCTSRNRANRRAPGAWASVRVSHLDDESEDCGELADSMNNINPGGEPRNMKLGDS